MLCVLRKSQILVPDTLLTHFFLKEIGLSLEANQLHEVEWVLNYIDFWLLQSNQEMDRTKLYVSAHETGIHAQ